MKTWLIIYSNGLEEILEAEDLYDLHNKLDSDYVKAVIKLDKMQNVKEIIYGKD